MNPGLIQQQSQSKHRQLSVSIETPQHQKGEGQVKARCGLVSGMPQSHPLSDLNAVQSVLIQFSRGYCQIFKFLVFFLRVVG